jgi:hypothetical protein
MTIVLFGITMNTFGQTPVVTVIQPNIAGTEWLVGTTHLISWTDNFTNPVKIDLVDYTVPLTPVITNITLSAVGSTYSWAIPALIATGTHYKIKVSSAVCGDCYMDESNNFFSLVTSTSGTSIHVEQPNISGINWVRGTTNLISWIDDVEGNVKIELINDDLIASDNASYIGYAGGLWGAGTNGGFGFEPWLVEYTGTTGGIVDNPAGIGIIGMDNPSFHLESSTASHIYTDRPFSAPLQVGSTFSFDWAVNIDNGGSGSKGIEIYTGYISIASPGTKIIDIKHGSGNIITINGSPMFNFFGLHVMNLRFEYEATNTLHVYGIGRDGSEIFDQDITITGAPNAIRFAAENMADMNISRRIYFNNLKITTPDKLLAGSVVGSTYAWNITSDIPYGNHFKVRISSATDANIKDLSDNYFTISAPGAGTITVLQPNVPGITWVRGNSYLISWIDNISGTVDIKLFKGGIETSTIASNVVGSTYVWPIPAGTVTGTDYTIKVISHDGPGTFDESNNCFSIQSNPAGTTITVQQPNVPGISWLKGSSYLISWIDNVPGTVKISLYKSGVLHSVIAENVPGSTYTWTVPNNGSIVTASDYKIRVSCMGDGTIEDFSNNDFSIGATGSGTITVLQPDVSGITWVRGNSYLISWIDNITGTMDIELFKGGSYFSTIATNISGSTFVWPISIATPTGTDYSIKIYSHTDAGSFDFSGNNFAIQETPAGGTMHVIQPNGGENWFIGNSYYISWDDNFPEAVDIDLVDLNGVFVSNIASGIIGSTYVWNTTGILEGDYKVKIYSTLAPAVSDMSDAVFHLLCLPLMANVYPNPVDNSFTVKFEESYNEAVVITFTDRFNLQVFERAVNTQNTKELQISTADLPNGIYFLSIISDKSVITKKVIVQH